MVLVTRTDASLEVSSYKPICCSCSRVCMNYKLCNLLFLIMCKKVKVVLLCVKSLGLPGGVWSLTSGGLHLLCISQLMESNFCLRANNLSTAQMPCILALRAVQSTCTGWQADLNLWFVPLILLGAAAAPLHSLASDRFCSLPVCPLQLFCQRPMSCCSPEAMWMSGGAPGNEWDRSQSHSRSCQGNCGSCPPFSLLIVERKCWT